MGTFIDSDHLRIKVGTVDRFFCQIFQLRDYYEEMGSGSCVALVPSMCDAHHDFVFPQPPFNMDDFEDLNQQITIGCCTVDVLRHLSGEEISWIPEGSSNGRLSRLATHVLNQHRFYPLFTAGSGLPLDLSVAPEALHMLSIPSVLTLPSDFASFAKVLHPAEAIPKMESGPIQNDSHEDFTQCKTVCINPGRLAKGIRGGTFADLFSLEINKNSTIEDAGVYDRTKISIMRI